MNILAIGHSYIVDTNRQFWSTFSKNTQTQVDLICPLSWQSNLQNNIIFKSSSHDHLLNHLYPIPVFFSGKASYFFFKIHRFYKILCSKKYDAIYLYQETWSIVLFQLIFFKLFSLNLKTPIYLYVHQNIIKKKLFFMIPWEVFLSLFLKKIFYSTSEIKEVLEWKRIKTPHRYLPLSYDENIYNQLNPSVFTGSEIRIGYLGRITKEKGIKTLVDACSILQSQGLQIKLILAGKGPYLDEISNDFTEYLGIIPHNQAHLFYQKIDLFILPSITTPSWKEQFGRVLVEAIASGVPVIGSSSGSIPEILNMLQWNFVFQENSPESLAKEIQKIIAFSKENVFKESLQNSIHLNTKYFSTASVCQQIYQEFNFSGPRNDLKEIP